MPPGGRGAHLSVVADVVAEADEAGLELLRLEAAGAVAVKVEEGLAELIHLVIRDALRVSGEDLGDGRNYDVHTYISRVNIWWMADMMMYTHVSFIGAPDVKLFLAFHNI